MSDSAPRVTILGAQPGPPGHYLDEVRDPVTGQYFGFEALPDGPEAQLHEQGATGAGVTCAVIDTGVLTEHPTIKRALLETVDFTGEGPQDFNGHGTIVTLIFLVGAPDANVISVKALDAAGEADRATLIDAINWCRDWREQTKRPLVVNLSCGCYTPSCQGDCPLCTAAAELGNAGAIVSAAAGNQPGDTTCPAKLGVYRPDAPIFVVGAYDADRHAPAPYSGNVGPKGFLADLPRYLRKPV